MAADHLGDQPRLPCDVVCEVADFEVALGHVWRRWVRSCRRRPAAHFFGLVAVPFFLWDVSRLSTGVPFEGLPMASDSMRGTWRSDIPAMLPSGGL